MGDRKEMEMEGNGENVQYPANDPIMPGDASDKMLKIRKGPGKTAYKPGEAIDYAGLVVELAGNDVTGECQFSVLEGTAWGREMRRVDVVVYRSGAAPATFELKRKANRLVPVLCVLLVAAICAGAGATWWFYNQPVQGDTGSYLIPKGTMSDEEAQALLDEMAEKSRITVSLAPYMVLKDDGQLRVNLMVPEENNGLSERVEVEQNGKVVYKSGIVEPGSLLVWGESSGATLGPATATVYAVANGADSGNPVSVEVEIVEPGFKAPGAEDENASSSTTAEEPSKENEAGAEQASAEQAPDGQENEK